MAQVEERSPGSDLVVYEKPYFQMSNVEKKAWRHGNKKKFIALGYTLTSVGGGGIVAGIEMFVGASLREIALTITGFEIATAACFLLVAGIAYILMLLPWEDA